MQLRQESSPYGRQGIPPPPVPVVHIASGDLWGGAEAQIYHLLRELRGLPPIAPAAILLNHGLLERRLRDAGVPVAVADERQWGSVRIGWFITELLRRLRPRIIHTHRKKENVLGSIASLFVPAALSLRTVHGGLELEAPPWHLRRHLSAWVDRSCGKLIQRKVVSVSPELAQRLKRDFKTTHLSVIENGVDIDDVRRRSHNPSAQLPGGMGRLKVGLVGRMVPVKRADLFLQAAARVVSKCPDRFAFYLLGDGPQEAELRALARNLDLARDLHFLGFREEIPPWLGRLDALLICSDHEGLPMVLLEALALEVPVIAHAVGGIPEVLGATESGLLVHDHSPEGYAEALLHFADERDFYMRRSHQALPALRLRYSAQACAGAYRRLYLELLGEGER